MKVLSASILFTVAILTLLFIAGIAYPYSPLFSNQLITVALVWCVITVIMCGIVIIDNIIWLVRGR